MGIKDIKAEARRKLALNIHQAIILYTIEYVLFATLIAIIVMACFLLGTVNTAVAVVMIIYGCVLLLVATIGTQVVSYATADFYLVSYKCKPYNIRRLGDVLARSGMTKVLVLSLKRIIFAFLLLLCLIVPGVIYLIRTSMAAHLLIANPKMSASTALSASNKVMSGKTGAYFSLMASLTGWWLLGIVTAGLGFVFIFPYTNLCKTVYYKRNLQGDTSSYRIMVQPISPVVSAPEPVAINVRELRDEPLMSPQDADRPIRIETPVEGPIPPIDTFVTEDVEDMNDAMRSLAEDRNVPEVQEIPEVAIPPIGVKPVVEPDQQYDEEKRVDDSNVVEKVRKLTTDEIAEANVMGKRIDRMFSENPQPEDNKVKRNYMADAGNESPDDFITREHTDAAAKAEPASDQAAKPEEDYSRPIMTDQEFAEFLRTFEVPEQEESTPKAQSRPQRTEAARPGAARQDNAQSDVAARIERLRREREERLKNSGK